MNARGLKFVRHTAIEDHLRKGWMILIPNGPMHHHYYGCELAWICPCPIPGLKYSVNNRVPETTSQESADDGAGRQQPA